MVLQMLHAECQKNGVDLTWSWYPPADEKDIEKFEATFTQNEIGWDELEPSLNK